MSKGRRHALPTDVRMGWVDTDVKRDAVELAKGDAIKHLRAYENAWFAVMPFLGGHLWEVHENGSGHSYLPAAVEALAKGVDQAWFQVGNRAHTMAVRDGRPQCLIQNVAQSKLLIDGDKPQIRARGHMQPVVRKGKGIFAFGAAVFGTGFLFLVASGTGYVALERMVPDPRVLDVDNLPYKQWAKVRTTADGLYVEALKFQNNQWTTAVKPVIRTSLADPAPAAQDTPGPGTSRPVPPIPVAATATFPQVTPSPGAQPIPVPPRPTPPSVSSIPATLPAPAPSPVVAYQPLRPTPPVPAMAPPVPVGMATVPPVAPSQPGGVVPRGTPPVTPPVRAVGPGVTGSPPGAGALTPVVVPGPARPGIMAGPGSVPPAVVQAPVQVPHPPGAPVPPTAVTPIPVGTTPSQPRPVYPASPAAPVPAAGQPQPAQPHG